jgi:hypothetical protein
MTINDFESKAEDLFDRWEKRYPDRNLVFSHDGISDYGIWTQQKLKVLFLLKEAHSGYEPNGKGQPIVGLFGWNLARWSFALKELYQNPNVLPSFPSASDLPKCLDDLGVAIVEVKKIEGTSSSNNLEIESYARKDKDLLQEQIELIDPQVVFCCGTNKSYELIFDWKSEGAVTGVNYFEHDSGISSSFWIHEGRLIIYFYHPSNYTVSAEAHYDLLCKMIHVGKAFEKLAEFKEFPAVP